MNIKFYEELKNICKLEINSGVCTINNSSKVCDLYYANNVVDINNPIPIPKKPENAARSIKISLNMK